MQVTKDNFKQIFPQVSKAVADASFLAVDGEFSGLDTGQAIHAFDTLPERYLKQRKAAQAYIIVQFGLSTFQYKPEIDQYEVQSFNFYICPRPYNRQASDLRFQCQSSSIDFLSSQGLDFNKVFRDGISYLLPSETQKLLESLKQRHERRNALSTTAGSDIASPSSTIDKQCVSSADNGSPSSAVPHKDLPEIPEQHRPFINDVLKKIEEFTEGCNATCLDLEPCNAYIRRLIYQTVQHKYGKKLRLESVNSDRRQHIRVTFAKTAEEYEQMERERQNAEYQELDDASGFTKVIKLLSQSGKLIVGHNMILDILHIVQHFVSPLPEDYEEFKDLIRCVFPRILDTKVLASSEQLKDFLPNTTLADMQKDLEKSPFSQPRVITVDTEVGYSNKNERLHEAGYDSYITGLCFISMTDYLGSIAKPPVTHVEVNSSVIRKYMNKLYLMRMTDISFINLEGPDALLSRDHVFHLTFPETWKLENISSLFSPFGNVQVAWLDETSAFVGLYRREQADAVIRSLASATGRAYRLLTYEQFTTMSAAAVTATPVTVVGNQTVRAQLSGKRKQSSSDVITSPVHQPRKRSGRFSVGSADIPTIPEEDINDVEESEAAELSSSADTKQPASNKSDEPEKKKLRMSIEEDGSDSAAKLFDEPSEW